VPLNYQHFLDVKGVIVPTNDPQEKSTNGDSDEVIAHARNVYDQ
jgi:hypothetical protein